MNYNEHVCNLLVDQETIGASRFLDTFLKTSDMKRLAKCVSIFTLHMKGPKL